MNAQPLYNEDFNLGPSYNAHSGGSSRAVGVFKILKMCLRCQWPSCKGKQFDTRESLSDHFSVHYAALLSEATKDGSLSCRWHGCSANKSAKAFQSLAVLRKHLTGHVKKYWCLDPKCALAFARKSDLARHIVHIHSDDRNYNCTVPGCERGYKRKDKLDEHLRKDHDHWACPFDHCTAQVLGANRQSHLMTTHDSQDSASNEQGHDGIYECGFPSCETTTSKFNFTNACQHLRSCHFIEVETTEITKAAKDAGPVPDRDMAFVLSASTFTGVVYHCRICPRITTVYTQLEPNFSLNSTQEALSSMKSNLRPSF